MTALAPCGRPWGTKLWAGGPILGGTRHLSWAERRDKYTARHAEINRSQWVNDPHTSTHQRRLAALRYCLASYGIDADPLPVVGEILAGDRDDIVRSLTGAIQ